ncbi:MAG: OFA family MFS transporter [Candidatus Riflebacteria bacterium]|nr:OFA family MFS transporter [Candidatus Riflebacteria bacterium]
MIEANTEFQNGSTEKWVVLAAGVVLQAVLGGIYAWSAFVPQLIEAANLSRGECGAIFGLTIATFAVTTMPAGHFLQKHGPRLTAMIGSLLFACGYLLASFTAGNFILMVLSYSLVIGTGIGFGYVCPLSTGMKWFPNNKGLVTGVAVAGFGGGAIILSSLSEYLIVDLNFGVFEVFRIIGIAMGGLAFFSSMFIVEPNSEHEQAVQADQQPLREHLQKRQFLLVFIGMFAGTFAGLLIVGNLKPMMLDFGLDPHSATITISLFAMGNILGRIFWGQVHDRLGSKITILLNFSFFFMSLMLLLHAHGSQNLMMQITPMIGAGFGGCFVIFASTIVEYFGVKLFARLYPVCFLGYGLAALTGPAIGGWLADTTNSFYTGINLSLATVLLAGMLVFVFFEDRLDEDFIKTGQSMISEQD